MSEILDFLVLCNGSPSLATKQLNFRNIHEDLLDKEQEKTALRSQRKSQKGAPKAAGKLCLNPWVIIEFFMSPLSPTEDKITE